MALTPTNPSPTASPVDFSVSQTSKNVVNPALLNEQLSTGVVGWDSTKESVTIRPPQIEIICTPDQQNQVSAVVSSHDGTQQASTQKAAAQELANIQSLVTKGSTAEVQQIAAFLVRRFNA